jgi:hypothetical protein
MRRVRLAITFMIMFVSSFAGFWQAELIASDCYSLACNAIGSDCQALSMSCSFWWCHQKVCPDCAVPADIEVDCLPCWMIYCG